MILVQIFFYRLFLICALVLPIATPSIALAEETVDQFRFLSMIIRDQLPSVQESKDFYTKKKTLSEFSDIWLASTEHKERIRRYFDDMFGTQKYMFISSENLDLMKSSHYIEISWDSKWIDFQDDSGIKSVALAANAELEAGNIQIQQPSEMVSLLNAKLNSVAGAGVTISASYNVVSDKITISATGTSVFNILVSTGTNSANSIAPSLGYSATDKTGALSYTAENIYIETTPNNMPLDLLASRELDVYFIPSFEVNSCYDGGPENAVLMDVWWSDTQQKICPTAVSPAGFNTAFYRIETEDSKIDFTDQDGTFSTSITEKSYKSSDDLATAIEAAMEAANPLRDYTVSYDATTLNFTVAVDSGGVQLAFGSSPNAIGNIVGLSDTFENSSHTGYRVAENHRCTAAGAQGFSHEDCGCGDKAFMCYPFELKGQVMSAVGNEFQNRAAHFYNSNGSWLDVFGGSKLIANRYLYHHYLYQQEVVLTSKIPTSQVIDDLMSLSLATDSEIPMPEYSSVLQGPNGVQRSGVVTSPGFLRRFNNFRSRTRAVVERMLCKDIDASLNIDNTNTFYNPNFANSTTQPEGQAVNEHGHKESCSNCHYSLDNFGSTIIMWADGGEGTFGEWAWWQKSQEGHVLGQTGDGPRFLMQTMVENQESGFYECMAKSAYEGFTGADWSQLEQSIKTSFVNSARAGPKETITKILKSKIVKELRSQEKTIETHIVEVQYDFATDINPILTNKCGGTSCHSAASSLTHLVGNKNNFDTINKVRIENSSMPPPSSAPLTATEKQVLLQYLNSQ